MALPTKEQVLASMSGGERDRYQAFRKAALVSYYTAAAVVVTGVTVVAATNCLGVMAVSTFAVIVAFGLAGGVIVGAPVNGVAGRQVEMKLRDYNVKPLSKSECVTEGIKAGVWNSCMLKHTAVGIATFVLLPFIAAHSKLPTWGKKKPDQARPS